MTTKCLIHKDCVPQANIDCTLPSNTVKCLVDRAQHLHSFRDSESGIEKWYCIILSAQCIGNTYRYDIVSIGDETTTTKLPIPNNLYKLTTFPAWNVLNIISHNGTNVCLIFTPSINSDFRYKCFHWSTLVVRLLWLHFGLCFPID